MSQSEMFMVQNASGYNSWPFIQNLGNRLVSAYSRGERHDIDEMVRGVYARVSDDGGRTWGAESVVVNTADSCESAIGKGLDENGNFLLWTRCIGKDWQNWHHDLYRSADGIASERIASLRLEPMPMQITDVMHVSGVGLMCFWFAGNYQDGPENAWGLLESKDNGITWSQHVVEDKLLRIDWPTEQCGIPLGDGRIFGIARNENSGRPENRQFQLQSTDNGKTWRKMRTNIADVNYSTPSLILDAKTNLVYNYYYERGQGLLKCRAACLDDVWDNPTAWPEPEVVATGSTLVPDAGNVNAVAANGAHYCTIYTGTERQTDIVLLRREI